jgi:hypothetical protein
VRRVAAAAGAGQVVTTTRQRAAVWGTGAFVSLLAGCYGWHPVACSVIGIAAALAVAVGVDYRRRP